MNTYQQFQHSNILDIIKGFDFHDYPKSTVVASLIALVLTFFLLIIPIYKLDFFKPETRNTVLILGQCNSGKTALFMQILHNKLVETVSSMTSNEAEISIQDKKNNNITLIDFPGHRKIQHGILTYIPKTKCIVYLIDATDKNNVKNSAEQLFELFTDYQVQERNLPILIACNKYDLPTARPIHLIQEELEKEIEKLRNVKATFNENSDSDDEHHHTENIVNPHHHHHHHDEEEPFSFDVVGGYVHFEKISVKSGNFTSVKDFINSQFK